MRRVVQSHLYENFKSLASRERTCLMKLRKRTALQEQSRQLFWQSRLNFLSKNFIRMRGSPKSGGAEIKKKRWELGFNWLPFALGTLTHWTYRSFQHYCLQPLVDALDEVELPEESEEDTEPLFFPLPLTWREIKQDSYRGSDPEWQEFVKFSKQHDLAQQIRRELANIILNLAKNFSAISQNERKYTKLRRYWLDVDFPSEPPPEYVQSGIEIGDDYIALKTQPVDSMTVRRTQRALWPSTMMLCTWSFVKVVTVDFFEKIVNTIGFNTRQPPTVEQLLARHRQLMRGKSIPPQDGPSLETQLNPEGTDVAEITSRSHPKQSQERSQDESEFEIEELLTELRQVFSRPIAAFKKTFVKFWKEPIANPPRGCLWVSGLVEIDTSKAYVVFDVKAHWDPRTRTYDMGSITLGLRRIQLKKQAPKEGD
ncbi:hypothetical protein GcC1_053020 [Golovinomyces cichoracearum]|uniref:Uncharacterized protein n=1 Tax=Golovinomyces cichoracearum TaxID=62708 RepID=A0A420IW01_9PEZI|nr:hypothetical protein GcC1_053020 [Golovinomyces cichoracearum]